MEALIVYKSVFHGNTKKIAIAMAEVLDAKLLDVESADKKIIEEYKYIHHNNKPKSRSPQAF
jgi:flavodoxin